MDRVDSEVQVQSFTPKEESLTLDTVQPPGETHSPPLPGITQSGTEDVPVHHAGGLFTSLKAAE